jgi:D-glycero-D-manno-heptose 1,7-bisphosphate phosphatase
LRPAAFLDRDGVLLRLVRDADGRRRGARSPREAELIDGVVPAVRALAAAGYACLVVTNQPDVARGTQSPAQLSAVHRYLRAWLPLTAVYSCRHDKDAGCRCRKPAPGMLVAAAARYRLDLASSVMFGDRHSDLRAARAAGCGFCWITADAQDGGPDEGTCASAATLYDAVRAMLADRLAAADVARS